MWAVMKIVAAPEIAAGSRPASSETPPVKYDDTAAHQKYSNGRNHQFSPYRSGVEPSASIDGANLFRTFWSVALPVARNGLFTVGTLIFLLAWGEFLYAVNFFLAPGRYPLSALLAQQVSAFGIDWPGLMALAVLTSIPILVVFSSTYRLLRDGLTVGAVK